ncbi:transposase [Streptomyces sp. OF3]|uniref:Transposase n=1 Tax=Streptomyces alkaliterrae TaxID=2213162 RepID=A0A7W3WJQ5_9ACTN|nr:transposase [Streptomyces alkaliterrae]MBB1253475.1 transposase [Streptomyces alkaliterrae]
MQVLSAERRDVIEVFTGLAPARFRRLVAAVEKAGGAELTESRPGRPWSLPLVDRVLLVAVYYRTNLTMRQLAPLFGISVAAVGRIIDRHAPWLALQPLRRRPKRDEVLIVDGTLVPTRDRAVAAPSKNYRYSTNLQVVIQADTRLVFTVGDPLPGNRNDCTAFHASGAEAACGEAMVVADGGYQCTGAIIPHRRRAGQEHLPDWKEEHNASHRRVRARVEHVFAQMKTWKILRDCRRRDNGVYWAATGIAHMHNLAHS